MVSSDRISSKLNEKLNPGWSEEGNASDENQSPVSDPVSGLLTVPLVRPPSLKARAGLEGKLPRDLREAVVTTAAYLATFPTTSNIVALRTGEAER